MDMFVHVLSSRIDMTDRPRRLRTSEAVRGMVRETRVSKDSLVYPFFVV